MPFKKKPKVKAHKNPVEYSKNNIKNGLENLLAIKRYTGSLAEQDINGTQSAVVRLLSSSVLHASNAGTLQPNPITMGTMLFPESPHKDMGVSIINAIRAMYPESSKSERKKKRSSTLGKNAKTLPNDDIMPSQTSDETNGETDAFSKNAAQKTESLSVAISMYSPAF